MAEPTKAENPEPSPPRHSSPARPGGSISPNSSTTTANRPPIGAPVGGRFAVVVDEFGEMLPPGLAGELCLGGEGSGFSAFVGSAINQPADRPRLERVLRY